MTSTICLYKRKTNSLRCVGVKKAAREMRQIRKARDSLLCARSDRVDRVVKLTNCVTIREEGSQWR